MSWLWFILMILLIIAFFVILAVVIQSIRKRRAEGPSHIELYFDENFRKIMDEWDFTTRDRVKDFKKDMGKRLSKVAGDIDTLEKKRTGLDKRMTSLETKMSKLEGL